VVGTRRGRTSRVFHRGLRQTQGDRARVQDPA
jgi:hypothetical protein